MILGELDNMYDFEIEKIIKEKVKIACEQRLSKHIPINVRIINDVVDDLIIKLESYYYQEISNESKSSPNWSIKKTTYRYPLNWFESCKQKLYSSFQLNDPIDIRVLEFLIKRWPIKWKYVTSEKLEHIDKPTINEFCFRKSNNDNLFQPNLFA